VFATVVPKYSDFATFLKNLLIDFVPHSSVCTRHQSAGHYTLVCEQCSGRDPYIICAVDCNEKKYYTGPSSETLEGMHSCGVGGGTEKEMYLLFIMKVLNKFAFALFAKKTC
jgi:hypothetical protein